MSKKLALSSALSVMLMASFALFGQHNAATNGNGASLFNLPAKAGIAAPAAPAALPILPGLR